MAGALFIVAAMPLNMAAVPEILAVLFDLMAA